MYSNVAPAEATLEIAGKMVNLRCPSKLQLRGALTHVGSNWPYLFVRGASKTKPINYVVDVGANVGGTALMFHSAFPKASVLAIEPVSINYDCMLHNIKDFPQITPLRMAAYNKRCGLRLSMPNYNQRPDISTEELNSGLFSVYGRDCERSELVRANRLDNIVDRPVDLLKIDVEGSEIHVLEGAERIMKEDRPILIIELREENIEMAGHSAEEYRDYFRSIKYGSVGEYHCDMIFAPDELPFVQWADDAV
jgi:FkbM family methyltransferase